MEILNSLELQIPGVCTTNTLMQLRSRQNEFPEWNIHLIIIS